jgi:hypothetical protein
MSNDDYAFTALGIETVKRIVKTISGKYKDRKHIGQKRQSEINRIKWLSYINKHNLDHVFLTDHIKEKDKNYPHDLLSAVDHVYCCYNTDTVKKTQISLMRIENMIINQIDKSTAFFIRIKFPTYKSLEEGSYFASQSGERYARWKHLIRLVNRRIHKRLKPQEFKRLLLEEPTEVIKKKKLIVDEKPIYNRKKIIRDLNITPSYPKFKEGEQKNKNGKRFEIVVSDENKEFIVNQFKNIALRYAYGFKTVREMWFENSMRFFIPSIGTTVIDHHDENKTPYLLGDVINIMSFGFPVKSTFIKIKHEDKELDIDIDFVEDWSIRPSDISRFSDDLYGRTAKWQLKFIDDVWKQRDGKPVISERTGMQYRRKTYKSRPDFQSIKQLFGFFDKEFDQHFKRTA